MNEGFNTVDSSWLFDLNPFKLTDTSTLNQLSTVIKRYTNSKKFIRLTIHAEGNFAGLDSELKDAIYYRMLIHIDSLVKSSLKDQVNILIDVDRNAGHFYLKGICIPSLELSFN